MTKEIKTEISTDCSFYKDVIKNEILIDGINVAGCAHLVTVTGGEPPFCRLDNFTCEGETCYYKQLKRLEQENRELSFAIEKCLENAGIECDDEEQALRNLPILGNAHYKVLVEKEGLEQENKELQAYKDVNEDFKKAWDELNEKYKQLRSALEEIRTYLNTLLSIDNDFPNTETYLRIQDKISEVLQ